MCLDFGNLKRGLINWIYNNGGDDSMVNLLEETLEKLKECGFRESDVSWVGSKDGEYAISWEEFKKIADIEYDNGYGTPEIAIDLVVVGKDWWLERHEYDGSE